MRKTVYNSLLILCAALVLAGCRKDLCYDHDIHGLKVRTVLYPQWELEWEYEHGIDWDAQWDSKQFLHEYEEFTPEKATGIAAFVYHEDGTNTENHLPAEGGELPVSEGLKSLLFYNDDTRYIIFSDLSSSATATATTRTRTRSTFSELHAGERTVNAPDILFGEWIEEHHAELTAEPVPLNITMQPLVYTYLVRYEFESGLEHVAMARGAIAGMAESVYLRGGITSSQSATILFDCSLTDFGAEAEVTSFGVPDFNPETDSRAEGKFGLNLEVRMKNGQFKTFEFDITEQVAGQPRGGVITVSGLEISDSEAGTGSGFDVTVEGWGEFQDIVLPL